MGVRRLCDPYLYAAVLCAVLSLSDPKSAGESDHRSTCCFKRTAGVFGAQAMGPVRIRHSSHDFAMQPSHSLDLAQRLPP